MSTTPTPKSPQHNGKYGLRFDQMDEEELEYYREFWEIPQTPEDTNTVVSEQRLINAKMRMVSGLSFTVILIGLLSTTLGFLSSYLVAIVAGIVIVIVGATILMMARRRYTRLLGTSYRTLHIHRRHKRWFRIAHVLAVLGVLCAIASMSIIPKIFEHEEIALTRSHVVLWNELSLLFLLVAALIYGINFLSVYTPVDDDESIIRPTDYAQQRLAQDLAKDKKRHDDEDFYDSSWISGR
ncbi:hypothetical protein [Rothia sp. CCM 9418]|uniref:hypothetical protein n=1 Tax=unclassified Rothia (in: high G+C Gram-positive bacteria) TaxID=2689056 RepID=UPI003AC7BF78